MDISCKSEVQQILEGYDVIKRIHNERYCNVYNFLSLTFFFFFFFAGWTNVLRIDVTHKCSVCQESGNRFALPYIGNIHVKAIFSLFLQPSLATNVLRCLHCLAYTMIEVMAAGGPPPPQDSAVIK